MGKIYAGIICASSGTILASDSSTTSTLEGKIMNQTIHCSVATCRHHNAKNVCELESIDVRPNCNCHSGKCDESMCGSYEVSK